MLNKIIEMMFNFKWIIVLKDLNNLKVNVKNQIY